MKRIKKRSTAQLSQRKSSPGSDADSVKAFGMAMDDHGNAFIAVIEKSLAKQRERVAERKAEAAKEKKEAAEKAAEKKAQQAEGKRTDGIMRHCISL